MASLKSRIAIPWYRLVVVRSSFNDRVPSREVKMLGGRLWSCFLKSASGGRSNMFSCAIRQNSTGTNVVTEIRGKVFLIGINRPEKRNCVNTATAQELIKAFETFENDDSLSAAVLHGIGGNFCAGYDLEELSMVTPADIEKFSNAFRPMGPSHILTTKPTIAAVSGYAVAGGAELALLCDLRVMEETAIMGIFCRRFGVPLIDGGTVRLPQLIGLSRALDMILTGRAVGAKEALEFGLANRVTACGTALGQAVNLANNISKFPQECMRADRMSTYYAMYEAKSLQDALQFEMKNGKSVLIKESIPGAQRFVSGVGKHGQFHLE